MNNQITIITGAAGNLGRAVSKQLVEMGCHLNVTLSPRDDPHFITAPNLESQVVNLTNEEETRAYVEGVAAKHGRIDLAVLIVGGFTQGNLLEVSSADIEKMITLNFSTAFYVIKPLLAIMKKQESGQIILIGARPGLDPKEGKEFVAYGLSKSMLSYLSEVINATFAGTAISSTVIAPSTIDTPGARKAMPEADFSTWVKPEDIAQTIAFVNSKAGKQLRHSTLQMYNRS